MAKITKNFSWWEFGPNKTFKRTGSSGQDFPGEITLSFGRRCNIQENIKTTASYLEVIREAALKRAKELDPKFLNKGLKVVSGFREESYNRKSKGRASKSYHLSGQAVDLRMEGLSQEDLYWVIKGLQSEGKIPKGGLACYRSFVHYDWRGWNARWMPEPQPKVTQLPKRQKPLRAVPKLPKAKK